MDPVRSFMFIFNLLIYLGVHLWIRFQLSTLGFLLLPFNGYKGNSNHWMQLKVCHTKFLSSIMDRVKQKECHTIAGVFVKGSRTSRDSKSHKQMNVRSRTYNLKSLSCIIHVRENVAFDWFRQQLKQQLFHRRISSWDPHKGDSTMPLWF